MQIKDVVKKHGRAPDKLLKILLEVQSASDENYLTYEDIKSVADEMNLPDSRVYSVASFYTLLSTAPRGRYIIQVCNDVPCYVNGSLNIVDALEKQLGIKMGGTTKDKLFTLEYTSCLGCCDNPPAMRIGSKLYSGLTEDKLADILRFYGEV